MSVRVRTVLALGLVVAVASGMSACSPRPMIDVTRTATPSPTASAATTCAPTAAPRSNEVVPYSSLPTATTFSDQVAAADGKIVSLGDQIIDFDDFRQIESTFDGGELGPAATGIVGVGPGRTVFEMSPHSSTHASDVATTPGAPNQLSLLQVVGDHAVLHGFSVIGTDQGHLYNGLRVARVTGLRASDIHVSGIPGNSSSPPGETFGINDFRTTASRWTDIDVDGAGVGASGFGVNSSKNTLICNAVSRNNPVSMGFAFWQSSGAVLIDCTATDNGYSGFNFERSSGTNILIRPVATGNRYAMRVASDQVSAKFTIVDPQLVDGHWTVTLPIHWNHVLNKQLQSDFTLIIDGRSRPDLLRFQTY